MAVFPVTHFTWQCLRVVKRSKNPPTGRMLRLVPNRQTKDGTFLNELVERGLLNRVSGTATLPFEATYGLTERGEYAAEYGECDMSMETRGAESLRSELPKPTKRGKESMSKGKSR